jgi:2-amino-4-hydroxy-6-hydroxymethyldihydropteridine diphosphokinase
MSRVFVSIGSNIEPRVHVPAALAALRAAFGKLSVSRVYESVPVGFDGDNFYNLVVGFDSAQPALEIAERLRQIERAHGRVSKGGQFNARTLDLDLLLYGQEVTDGPELHLPRREITEHAFVLWPLAEIAGDRRHPVLGETYAALRARLDFSDQRLWVVEMGV